MKCPYCGGKTRVSQSRQREKFFQRRHICQNCHTRFSTYEITTKEYRELIRYMKTVKVLESIGMNFESVKTK